MKNIGQGAMFALVLLLIPVLAQAQDITLTSKLRSSYLGGNGAYFYKGRVVQSDINLSWQNGVYADWWASSAFNTEYGFDKEVDATLGKNGKLGSFNYNIEGQYIKVVVIDVINLNSELSRSFSTASKISLEPFLRLETYFPVQHGGPRRGLMGIGGLRASRQLNPRLTLLAMDRFKKDTGCFGFNSTVLNQSELDLAIKASEKLTITPVLEFSVPLAHVTDGRKGNLGWQIKFSYRF